MSARITLLGNTEAHHVWTGHAELNRAGVKLAVEMLDILRQFEPVEDDGVSEGDRCSLFDWPREGRPFRNIVAEYLRRAHKRGPDVEAAFCAVMTDLVALVCQDEGANAERYAEMYGIE